MAPTPDTINPPIWHVLGSSYDPVTVPFASNTVNGSPFTCQPFNNGDGASLNIFGPPRICKDGWIAYAAGIVTVPTITTSFGVKICQLPLAYYPLHWSVIANGTLGIWGGAVSSETYLIIDNAGGFFIRNDGGGTFMQNAQWASFAVSWVTGTYGE